MIVCTRNRPRELELCLQALARLRYPDYEVLVVENGTPDSHTRKIAEHHGARYLNSPIVGLSRARNDAAKNCKTELLAYTDDDAIPREDWLMNLASEFRDPSIMAVAGEMVPPPIDGQTTPSCLQRSPEYNREQVCVVGPNTPDWFSLTNFGQIGDGSNMCFRRTAFELWPGFDERLGRGAILNSAEEHFSFFQLVLRGYQCVHTPHAIVQHPCLVGTDEVHLFHRTNLINAVAYAGLLWVEFPETRGLLLKHLWSRSFGERRRVRTTSVDKKATSLSIGEQLAVIAAGLRLFRKIPRTTARRAP